MIPDLFVASKVKQYSYSIEISKTVMYGDRIILNYFIGSNTQMSKINMWTYTEDTFCGQMNTVYLGKPNTH